MRENSQSRQRRDSVGWSSRRSKKKKRLSSFIASWKRWNFQNLLKKHFWIFQLSYISLGTASAMLSTHLMLSFSHMPSPSITTGAVKQEPCLILTPWQCLAQCLVHSRCSVNANWIHIRKQAKVLYTTVAQAIPRGVLAPEQRIASLRPFWVD